MKPEMAYCGKDFYAAGYTVPFICAPEKDGYGDGACPSCLRSHITRLEAAMEGIEHVDGGGKVYFQPYVDRLVERIHELEAEAVRAPASRVLRDGEVAVAQAYLDAIENAANQFCGSCRDKGSCSLGMMAIGKGCGAWRLDAARINALRTKPTEEGASDGWERIETAPVEGVWFRGRNARKREFDVKGDGDKHKSANVTFYDRDGLIRDPKEWKPLDPAQPAEGGV